MHNNNIKVKVGNKRSQKHKAKTKQTKNKTLTKSPEDMSNLDTVIPPLDGSHNKVMEVEWFRETQHFDRPHL